MPFKGTQRYLSILKHHQQHLTVLQIEKRLIFTFNSYMGKDYLVETDIGGVLTEALTAEVKVVLADQGSSLSADTAKERKC